MWELDFVEVLGLVAAILTTASFLPQVWQTWKTKDVKGLSLTMYLFFVTGVALWVVYGIYTRSLAIVLANAVTLILGIILLVLKFRYDKK